jgi:predicted lipoprotein with Yx(FWY)xxD motif
MRRLTLLSVMAITTSVLAGPAPALASSSTRGEARSTLTVRDSRYGRILFDGRGFALYAFTADPKGKSVCKAACAAAWPPYLVARAARPGAGTQAQLLGTTRRADGKLQVTYAGRPLYYYVGERSPGQILCQNVREFGGLWLVARANGTLVRTS